jgi:hypothetical protein
MTVIATPTREIFDNAIQAGRNAGQATAVGTGLNASLLASLQGRVNSAWSEITDMLDKAFIYGRAKIEEAYDASIAKINSLLDQAGGQVQLLHALLMDKIRAFMRTFLEGALGLLPREIVAGGVALSMKSMTFTQSIKVGGSIEANLMALASLVSEGEIGIASEYGIAAPPNAAAV